VKRAYLGCADQMIGPSWYGYIDQWAVYLGEKGGKYLVAGASIDQESRMPDGHPRIPVWSDEKDRIVIACPSSLKLRTVEETQVALDSLMWVHLIDRDPSKFRHDLHPMDPRCAIRDMDWTSVECVVLDSLPKDTRGKAKNHNFMSTLPYGFGSMPTGFIPSLPNTMVTDPPWEVVKPRLLTIPVFDENGQIWKQWKVRESSKVVKELVAAGKISRTPDGRYYVVPEGSVTIKKNAP
jgi:hypothetical protein